MLQAKENKDAIEFMLNSARKMTNMLFIIVSSTSVFSTVCQHSQMIKYF